MSSVRASSPRHPERSPRVQLRLRVFSGVHSGAEFRMPERGILMIGQADDCDLILGDEGIAGHHCVLTVIGDQVLLRALEGTVATDDRQLAPGDSMTLEHFAVVRMGEVRFAVGSHWSERWQNLADATEAGLPMLTDRQLDRRRLLVLGSAGLLLLVAVLVLLGSWRVTHSDAPAPLDTAQQLQQAQAIVRKLSLPHVAVGTDDSGRLTVRGVVGNATQLPQLRQQLAAANLSAEVAVRDWPSVAKQVTEIFAMHGYTVDTTLLDQNQVQVSGHFGSADNVEKVKRDVYGSADMQSLNSDAALSVSMRNFDEKPAEAPKPDPGKRIKHVFRGNDEYLVTQDESRYYPDQMLPQGGVFLHVTNSDEILVRTPDNHYAELDREDGYTALHPVTEDAVASLINPAPAASSAEGDGDADTNQIDNDAAPVARTHRRH
ncbi:FHA domain-containing protein [Dyella sp.]|uniref:FHA domain-containing protein n=1 Tax=Dyella sp. TaxID=1869338 RepID=UPI002ED5898F